MSVYCDHVEGAPDGTVGGDREAGVQRVVAARTHRAYLPQGAVGVHNAQDNPV